jgi:hypothetical protein
MQATGDTNFDGYNDLIVGQPQLNGSGAGWIWCVSGRYLATGFTPDVLWATSPSQIGFNGAARFGSSICEVASLTGDAAADFVVGAPNYIPAGTGTTTGALFLVDGSTHQIAAIIEGNADTHLGGVVVAVGDQDGDGKIDVAANAIAVQSNNNHSFIHVVSGASFFGTKPLASTNHWSREVGWHDYGAALASGFDLDGDGLQDLAASVPSYGFSFPGAGSVEVRRANSSFGLLGGFTTNIANEHMGASIDARHDYNGDGIVDFVCGAPNWTSGLLGTEDGRVLVASGAGILNLNLPLTIYTFNGLSGVLPTTAHFGACVRASDDLNGDGVGDILVGSPEYKPSFPPLSSIRGAVYVFSGATGARIGVLTGNPDDHLGDALVGGFDDLDNDGFPDFAAAASTMDSPFVDCGVIKAVRLFPSFPDNYCTAKLNSLGCTPAINGNGSASKTSLTPFLITCSNVLNQRTGFLIYSHRPDLTPFQGGFQCVQNPFARTPGQAAGGTVGGNDCTGTYSFDYNAWIRSGIDPSLLVGAEVFAQYRSRDPQSSDSSSLSNAIRFVVNP